MSRGSDIVLQPEMHLMRVTLILALNGRDYGAVTVADTAKPQTVRHPKLTFTPGKRNRLILQITEVYRGQTHDTCIADIVFDGFGAH